MSQITMDFETYSEADIKKVGNWKYSEHPSTTVLCLYWKYKGVMYKFIEGDAKPKHLFDQIEECEIIEAHNMSFEFSIWLNVCMKKMGWPALPFQKLRCSAAVARYHSLPGSLDGASKALGNEQLKDSRGKFLIRKLCQPQKERKVKHSWPLFNKEPVDPELCEFDFLRDVYKYKGKFQDTYIRGAKAGQGKFKNVSELLPAGRLIDEQLLQELYDYCEQDVITEEGISEALSPLPESELKVWQLDLIINSRGVHIDKEMVDAALVIIRQAMAKYEQEAYEIGNGAFETLNQREVVLNWIREQGYPLKDYTADTIKDALADENCKGKVRRILELRQITSRTSVKKFDAIERALCEGDLMKGVLLYFGAHTGRWAGRILQPQNLPRPTLKQPEIEYLTTLLKEKVDLELLEMIYPDVMNALVSCIRASIIPRPGNIFYCADYSNVEGRVALWCADDQQGLDIFREDRDIYIEMAMDIYKVPFNVISDNHTKGDGLMRRMGKLAILGLGYGMGADKFKMTAEAQKVMVTRDFAQEVVDTYREKFDKTKKLWYILEKQAINAIENVGKSYSSGPVRWLMKGNTLLCRLPSGRCLHYPKAETRVKDTPWGEKKKVMTYMSDEKGRWVRESTFGGKLLENIVQAISRDLLVYAMFKVEAAGYRITMSVHDELLTERKIGEGSIEELNELMSELPDWAAGLPLAAEGWCGYSFRK